MTDSFKQLWVLLLSLTLYCIPTTPTPHVHIVYLGHNHGQDPILTTNLHLQLLSSVFSKEKEARKALLYSYNHGFSGFSAMLNPTQATTLASMEGVISVFRSKMLQLHTTRSWDFMGLKLEYSDKKVTPMQLKYGEDVIVGIFDTGIWPESESLKEEPNLGPIPASWRGACVKGEKFDPKTACNRKLIGARYYINGFERQFGPLNTSDDAEFRSPRDRHGHGTHTASTAVGSIVANASFFGLARGVARGGAPRARLAVYKICWFKDLQGRCSEADILAAFDDALRDGVHVISASLGASPPLMPFFSTSTDVGSFHAMQMGVTAVFSAGNDGPEPTLVQNVSPWGLCVAAGTIDRTFPTQITLGNNASFMGQSFNLKEMKMELIDSGNLFDDGSCSFDKWNRNLASGKIVLCFSSVGQVSSTSAALAILAANGSAMIFADTLTKRIAQDDFLPTVHVDLYHGTQFLYYIRSSKGDSTVHIYPSKTSIGSSPAPTVAYFSSRGPSSMSPNILKPDIAAPGVNILAAWPPKSSPSLLPFDGRSVSWNVDSGTSMSCPHVSGVVALIKSAHPTWSHAAIKSAIMTTAYTTDTSSDIILAGGTLKPIDPFDIGAGHVNPTKALDPGLIYDMEARDHVIFLCSIGYSETQIKRLVIPSSSTDTSCRGSYSDLDINYPAIIVSDLHSTVTIKRTLRNVGQRNAIYYPNVRSPQGVYTFVWPKFLLFSFHKVNLSYYVTVKPMKQSQDRYDFGEIVWSDGYHSVRTPLIVRVNNAKNGVSDAGYQTA